jgi:hypothetical protein
MDVEQIAKDAFKSASIATADYLDKNPEQWFPCGFAWVRIRPARGKFVAHLKELDAGRIDAFKGGFVVYDPSGNGTQSMNAKFAGANAFAEVLRANGINAFAESRMD